MNILSNNARNLILSFEGMDQPERWPDGASGITLGHGFDLGYSTLNQFTTAWKQYLKPEHFELLKTALGVTGHRAEAIRHRFHGITVTTSEADEVFERCTIPRWSALTEGIYPGISKLPVDAQGALVSLCFNRGTELDGARRREMANIRDIIKFLDAGDITVESAVVRIAGQIRGMKRLWPLDTVNGKGLQRRREAEAVLVEKSITPG